MLLTSCYYGTSNGTVVIIFLKSENEKYHCEVKYFGIPPEFTLPNGMLSAAAALNYIYFRIGEAVLQLEKYPINSRQAFFVFDGYTKEFNRELLEPDPSAFQDWCISDSGEYLGINKLKGFEIVVKHKPDYWLSQLNTLTIATIEKFELSNIK